MLQLLKQVADSGLLFRPQPTRKPSAPQPKLGEASLALGRWVAEVRQLRGAGGYPGRGGVDSATVVAHRKFLGIQLDGAVTLRKE
jgi:hypothetical protein